MSLNNGFLKIYIWFDTIKTFKGDVQRDDF